MRRTKEEAAGTRSAILKAANELFLEKGYDAVSLEEIAGAAGVTRGAVHWHFRNKQGLLLAIRDEARLPLQELADSVAREAGLDPLKALAEVISATFRHFQADPRQRALLKILLRLDSADDADESQMGRTFQQQLRASLATIFRAAGHEGQLPSPWTPDSAAMAFEVVISGLVNEWARGRADFQLIPDGEAIVQAIIQAWQAQLERDRQTS